MPERVIKPIFVRLSEAERRRVRTLAVSQGLTMREAVIEAFEAWAKQLRSGAPTSRQRQSASGPTQRRSAGSPSEGRGQPSYAPTGQQVGRPADVRPSEAGPSLVGLASVPGLEALAGDWVGKAVQLDWSTCPAAESVQTKRGAIWVAAGTLTPLVHVFEPVEQGHPFQEIAEVYGLTMPQLMALLQFAAEGAAPSAPSQ